MKRDFTEFAVLPAYHGDCILINTFDDNNDEFKILIDGGTAQTFRYTLKAALKDVTRINLLVLTHIDSDHIAGLISLFKSTIIDNITIDEIWMNHPEIIEVETGELISTKQADTLKELILQKKPDAKLSEITTLDETIVRRGLQFEILSPTPQIIQELYLKWESSDLPVNEDGNGNVNISTDHNIYSQTLKALNEAAFAPEKSISGDIFNSSSISFILRCFDLSILLLADSRPEVIAESLRRNYSQTNPLQVDYVKVSHHGSINNTSQELLSLIQSDHYIISTNGGSAAHKHPSRETIARLVYNSQRKDTPLNIYFNYEIEDLKERIGKFINEADSEDGNWKPTTKNLFKKNDK
ncbi:ComEC/Rec2 family competence protein [Flavobacterium plurextorum]|uniref:ComEC/Rec2 family competence protein n=1 Tax=Flavobacterium TaxID=237 RepID=UPI00351A289E